MAGFVIIIDNPIPDLSVLTVETRAHTMEHRLLMQLVRELQHGSMSDNRKLHLRRLLISRLQMNKQANQDVKLLGLYRSSTIEEWTVGQTSADYDSTTFDDFFERISESRLFHAEAHSDGTEDPYYRKPAQFLAAAMALAAYSERDVEAAIKKLWQSRKERKMADSITVDYMKSARFSQSVKNIRSLVQGSESQRRPRRGRSAFLLTVENLVDPEYFMLDFNFASHV
ncbi:hypothetical protein SI65_01486 [Aspergillus cristatus]|uniref:Uncharacterized protein n=1 Tax=Aspergillus cristatus TaxID=573508 RepID=A0A1E3BU68_ASPCR|nr:hypothetical protein SI65_01486 [Aspergillus cristatus]